MVQKTENKLCDCCPVSKDFQEKASQIISSVSISSYLMNKHISSSPTGGALPDIEVISNGFICRCPVISLHAALDSTSCL